MILLWCYKLSLSHPNCVKWVTTGLITREELLYIGLEEVRERSALPAHRAGPAIVKSLTSPKWPLKTYRLGNDHYPIVVRGTVMGTAFYDPCTIQLIVLKKVLIYPTLNVPTGLHEISVTWYGKWFVSLTNSWHLCHIDAYGVKAAWGCQHVTGLKCVKSLCLLNAVLSLEALIRILSCVQIEVFYWYCFESLIHIYLNDLVIIKQT